MKTDIENNEWKAEAPYMAALQRENPFGVPEQYFEALPQSIANSVFLSQLKQVNNVSGFTVPDQYFTALKQQILTETTEDRTSGLPEATGYTTPDHYFESLQNRIASRTILLATQVSPDTLQHVYTAAEENEEQAPAVSIATTGKPASKIVRLWHSGLLKYATAACFVLLSTFGIYLNQHNFSTESAATDLANEQMLYDISEQDVIDHIEGKSPDVQKPSIADTDMENYILNNYSQNDLSSAL